MKRVLIVFDTKFGNTEKLGREIAAGIEESGTAECKVIGIKDVKSEDISGYDGVLFGGPVHAFRATRGIKGAVKEAAKKAPRAKIFTPGFTALVDGYEGPLNAAEPAKAREFGQRFAQELGN
jgi:menaquinone-dependent protoporphyrinogen IX oxidase